MGESGLEVFDYLSGNDVGIGEIGAVFEAFVFEPEPSRPETSETDGQAERPTERVRKSQDVEVSVESPASPNGFSLCLSVQLVEKKTRGPTTKL